MKEIAKQFLDRQIDRRTFVSRVAQVGVGASAASSLAGSLSASGQVGGAAPGRVLRGQTGGDKAPRQSTQIGLGPLAQCADEQSLDPLDQQGKRHPVGIAAQPIGQRRPQATGQSRSETAKEQRAGDEAPPPR